MITKEKPRNPAVCLESTVILRGNEALFLKRTHSLGANLELNFLTVYFDGFVLKIWFPNLFGVALAEADIAAVLFALAGEFAFLHYMILLIQGLIVHAQGVKVKTNSL